MRTSTPGVHRRHNAGLLAAAEKHVLARLARRLPDRVNADHLSAVALAAMGGTGVSFAAMAITPWAAAGVVISLALNWLGDSLDGTVARLRGHERPRYGYYVDHVLDLAGTLLMMAGLAVSGLMHPLMAAVVLAAYLLVSAETYLATHAGGVFRMSALGVGPTELRILIAAGAVRAAFDPVASLGALGEARVFDVGGAVAAAVLVVLFGCSAVRTARALYAAEPLPRTAGRAAAA